MRNLILSLAILIGLTGVANAAANTCYDPEVFGAIPNDGLDDAPAFQHAVDLAMQHGYDVCVGPGDFNIFPRNWNIPLGVPARLYAVFVTGSSRVVTIRGAGKGATRLLMSGNGGNGTWHMIGSEATAGFVLEHMTLDGSARTGGYAEHQMLIQCGYGTKNCVIRDVVAYHPELGPAAGGDCLSVVGGYTAAELVENVTVEDSEFPFCDRSAIAIQRSTRRVTVQRVQMKAGDQALDMEATDAADEFRWSQDISIRDVIVHGNGGVSMSLGRAKRIRFESSSVLNGTVLFLTAHSSSFSDVNIECPDTDISCIDVRRAVRGVELNNIRIVKPVGAVIPGPLLTVTTDPEGSPEGVRIVGGEYVQTTQEKGIFVGSAKVRIDDVEFRYEGPVPGNNNAVAIVVNTTTPSKPAEARIRDNTFNGTWTKGVLLGSNLGVVTVKDNIGTAQTGVQCEALGTTKARLVSDNVFFKSDGSVAPNPGCL